MGKSRVDASRFHVDLTHVSGIAEPVCAATDTGQQKKSSLSVSSVEMQVQHIKATYGPAHLSRKVLTILTNIFLATPWLKTSISDCHGVDNKFYCLRTPFRKGESRRLNPSSNKSRAPDDPSSGRRSKLNN